MARWARFSSRRRAARWSSCRRFPPVEAVVPSRRPEQRRQAEKLAKRSVVTKHDHDQGTVRLVHVEPKGTKIPLIIRGKLFAIGEDRRDECLGGVSDRHIMCRVDGVEGADLGLVQFISDRGELGVRRRRRRVRPCPSLDSAFPWLDFAPTARSLCRRRSRSPRPASATASRADPEAPISIRLRRGGLA